MKSFEVVFYALVVSVGMAAFFMACDEDQTNEDPTGEEKDTNEDPAGGENDVDVDEEDTATEIDSALVITTDWESGAYSTIDCSSLEAKKSVQIIHSDAVCRFDPVTEQVYVIARFGADAIDVVHPGNGWQVTKEYSVEAGTNPQDIAVVSADRAYVDRLAAADLLVVHPTSGTVIDRVDISAYADQDGVPEAAMLYHLDGKVFVLLQRLDPNLMPTDSSGLLVLDGATGIVESDIALTGINPTGKLRYSKAIERLVIIESGSFGVLDGGIEYFNPKDNTLSGFVITEEALGGDLVDAVIASENKGYAVVGVMEGESMSNRIVSFDPSTGTKLDDMLISDQWAYSYVDITPDNAELWVSDMTMGTPGVRIFDLTDDTEITETPIDVGLPPAMICFVE